MDIEELSLLLSASRGDKPAHILLKGGKFINVFTGEIYEQDIAIYDKYIVGIGDGYKAEREIDVKGKFLCPSFIDAHIHIESTFLCPSQFAKIVSLNGTGCVVCDPHEIANVMGTQGIELFIEMTKDLPLEIYFMAPSCVPATQMETSGGIIDAQQIRELYEKYGDRILGLAEVMNFPGTYYGDRIVLDKILASKERIIDGHSPCLMENLLNAYILAGPMSDHECVSREEALEKLRKGMYIFIREGSTEKNLEQLLPLVNEENVSRFCLVTDDRHADELMDIGHLNFTVKKAIGLGLDPILAIKMATINPATYFGLKRHGAIAPGRYANILVLDDIHDFKINRALLKGKEVDTYKWHGHLDLLPKNKKLNLKEVSAQDFEIIPKGTMARIIGIIPGQIITRELIQEPLVRDGLVLSDVKRDILKIAVIERYMGTGNMAKGLVNGLKLKAGAVASSVAHDSHNVIVAGVDDTDMAVCVNFLREIGGGIIVVKDREIVCYLDLPFGGLMSLREAEEVAAKMRALDKETKTLTPLGSSIFMHLSFLALPVIPKLKITDKGLVDVEKFGFVSLFVNGERD